ncbi:hypothetical protein CK203_043492 [Vitis vinifera]|uniref:Uncharacterized protein n=1 Tax=Vitis vinifera TaxID=29760 RepID=A0A438HRA7_VITVI|nr:hypothetical protein CK203_043492 [Vitis vinifera]
MPLLFSSTDMACSSPFWKKMESFFASVSLEDVSYLKQQLRLAEELDGSLSQMFGLEFDVLDSGDRQGSLSNQESSKADASCGTFDMRWRLDKVTPMYHRVLSALIEEDESEELYHHNRDRVEFEVESKEDSQSQKSSLWTDTLLIGVLHLTQLGIKACPILYITMSSHKEMMAYRIQMWGLSVIFVRMIWASAGATEYWLISRDNGRLLIHTLIYHIDFMYDSHGRTTCEVVTMIMLFSFLPLLQPDLAEGEEGINQEIVTLKEKLYQQVEKKKTNMGQIDKAVQNGRDFERRDIEQVAMNQLVEMAYRKRLVLVLFFCQLSLLSNQLLIICLRIKIAGEELEVTDEGDASEQMLDTVTGLSKILKDKRMCFGIGDAKLQQIEASWRSFK